MNKKRSIIIVVTLIIGTVFVWLIKLDRNINIDCIGKNRDEVLELLNDFPRTKMSNGKFQIVLGNSGGFMYFDNINQIRADGFVMTLPEWEVFHGRVHFALYSGCKYLVVKFNSDGVVVEQRIGYFYDG